MNIESSSTQTAVVGTTHTLAAPSTAKTRVLVVDLAALATGEVVELEILECVLSGGTQRRFLLQSFTGPVADPIEHSPPSEQGFGGTFTLKQTSGTGRAFPWRIDTLD